MKNDNMKKNGQFPNVRVEYGFGAVCFPLLGESSPFKSARAGLFEINSSCFFLKE